MSTFADLPHLRKRSLRPWVRVLHGIQEPSPPPKVTLLPPDLTSGMRPHLFRSGISNHKIGISLIPLPSVALYTDIGHAVDCQSFDGASCVWVFALKTTVRSGYYTSERVFNEDPGR